MSNRAKILAFRLCDSTDLNVSPLCDLLNPLQPSKWADEVTSLYQAGSDNALPDYIKRFGSPTRLRYSSDKRRNNELLKSLTKVFRYSNKLRLKLGQAQFKVKVEQINVGN